jgi:prepilin-type N-terminal cleavage/methylation domain-containing protein
MNLLRPKGGFTLIECLVATVILAIGVVGVASMFACATISERKASYMAQARDIADQTFECIRAQGYAVFTSPTGSTEVATPGLPRSSGVLAWQPYPDSSSEQGLKLVSLNLSWDWAGASAGRYWVTTLVSEQGGG